MNQAEKNFAEWIPTKIHFGEGSIGKIGNIIKDHSDNALVVIGAGSVKKSGLMEKIVAILDTVSIKYRVVEGVEPNPSKETVYKIAYHLLAGNFKCLVAIGGGSVIDAAKAAAILGSIREANWMIILVWVWSPRRSNEPWISSPFPQPAVLEARLRNSP